MVETCEACGAEIRGGLCRCGNPFLGKELKGKQYVDVDLELTCGKCGKTFIHTVSMPKNGPEPCLQGLLPRFCQECEMA